MSTTYIIFFGVDHCNVSTYLYKFLPMYHWRIGNIFLSPRTHPLFSSAIKFYYHDINILLDYILVCLSDFIITFSTKFSLFFVLYGLRYCINLLGSSGQVAIPLVMSRNELSRHPLIKPLPSLQARFQMHWDSKILVNCLPQGRQPSHMAMFSLQKMWHY